MICSKCGYSIEKKWKYCPNCSKKTNIKKNLIVAGLISVIIFIIVIVPIIKKSMPLNSKDLEKQLEKKYNENFDIKLLSSIKNLDNNLSCDGSSFGTIEGRGEKKYYKIYSVKNNMDFWAYYDTYDKSKSIIDNYELLIERKSSINDIYNYINSKIININKITLSYNYKKQNISIFSSKQLNIVLSNKNDNYIPAYFNSMDDEIVVYIEKNIFEYSKDNYLIINDLNNKLNFLRKKYYFKIYLYFNNNAFISLGELNDKAYVYDKYASNYAWGETLEEFVMRDNYNGV